jgi:Cys-tRNA(Pro)/Cys-tRNA(Cys) deacylase
MANKSNKLNSMRLLEANGIAYETLTYDASLHDAVEVAGVLGVPARQVYKTLVVERAMGGKPMLVMIAADRHLDLKRFAAAIGEKKINMATHADAEKLTGLKVGGIGALALTHKKWEVYLDQAATQVEAICVNAGQRGINLRVPIADLIRILNARVVEATEAAGSPDQSP